MPENNGSDDECSHSCDADSIHLSQGGDASAADIGDTSGFTAIGGGIDGREVTKLRRALDVALGAGDRRWGRSRGRTNRWGNGGSGRRRTPPEIKGPDDECSRGHDADPIRLPEGSDAPRRDWSAPTEPKIRGVAAVVEAKSCEFLPEKVQVTGK